MEKYEIFCWLSPWFPLCFFVFVLNHTAEYRNAESRYGCRAFLSWKVCAQFEWLTCFVFVLPPFIWKSAAEIRVWESSDTSALRSMSRRKQNCPKRMKCECFFLFVPVTYPCMCSYVASAFCMSTFFNRIKTRWTALLRWLDKLFPLFSANAAERRGVTCVRVGVLTYPFLLRNAGCTLSPAISHPFTTSCGSAGEMCFIFWVTVKRRVFDSTGIYFQHTL